MASPLSSFRKQRDALMGQNTGPEMFSKAISENLAALGKANQQAQASFARAAAPAPMVIPEDDVVAVDEGIYRTETPLTKQLPEALQVPQTLGGIPLKNDGANTGVFGELLARYEGGGNYDTLFGHSQRDGGAFAGVRPTQMTIGQVLDFTNPKGQYGNWVKNELAKSGQTPRIATPVGAGQIVGTTLRNASQAMGLSKDTLFNAQTQNAMIDYLAGQRLKNARSLPAARAGLRAEWEGFKSVPDSTLNQAIAQLGYRF